MKLLRLVWANLLRKKTRTILTLGSFVVALFLFGMLATVRGVFQQGIEVAGADRLFVINKISLIMPLPLSYLEWLKQTPGVKRVALATWFGGVYQDERNFFPQFAIDGPAYRKIYPEYLIPEKEWEEFLKDKQACVAGRSLAKRFGWKVGDRIPIQGTIWGGVWEFNLRAIYDGQRPQDDTTQFWFRWDYLEERRPFGKGTVGWYIVQVADPDQAVSVARAIDQRFANSPYETLTQTEKTFAAAFVKQMGNIELLTMLIGSVVLVTLLLVTGNTMAIAIRERTGEIAIMKTVGFTDARVLVLVLGESLLTAGIGGGVGLLLAKGFTLAGDPTGGLLGQFFFSPRDMAMGFALTLLVGVGAALIPAFGAMRLRVVDALRRV